jgi:hypothetical protein
MKFFRPTKAKLITAAIIYLLPFISVVLLGILADFFPEIDILESSTVSAGSLLIYTYPGFVGIFELLCNVLFAILLYIVSCFLVYMYNKKYKHSKRKQ